MISENLLFYRQIPQVGAKTLTRAQSLPYQHNSTSPVPVCSGNGPTPPARPDRGQLALGPGSRVPSAAHGSAALGNGSPAEGELHRL